MPRTTDVVVIGGGVIGCAAAWRLAQRGLSVVVVDPEPGRGATRTAAGMLAPVTELHYGEQTLLQLNLVAARRYPQFVGELEQVAGGAVGYRRTGTVVAAWDGADLVALRDLHEFQVSLGLDAQMLTGADVRRLEPSLAPGLPGGLFAADDHAVDPRRLHAALLAAATGSGTVVERQAARRLEAGERVTGVVLADGTRVATGAVVLAAGAWSGRIEGVPAGSLPPVRPVKGQTLRLRLDLPDRLTHVTRGSVRGVPVYLVPRTDGELVIGASSEEAGFDLRPRAGAVHDLLRDAQALLPAVLEMELVEVSTGLRPGSPDNAPLLGTTAVEGLVVATGHYRNGVLLAPVTADAVAAMLTGDGVDDVVAAFAPGRFAAATP